MKYTTVSHLQSDPDNALAHNVEAVDVPDAMKATREAVANDLGEPISPLDPLVIVAVFSGELVNLIA